MVARGGWSAALLTAPFGRTLPAVLQAYGKVDIQETVPRPRWDRRPVDRRPLPPPPGVEKPGESGDKDDRAKPPRPPEGDSERSDRGTDRDKDKDNRGGAGRRRGGAGGRR